MDQFAGLLRTARHAAGLTQLALAERSGIARPNIAAYERDRREPLFHTAISLLRAAGAEVTIEPRLTWSWTTDPRPYAVPSRLWRLPPSVALRSFDAEPHLWWSGPTRRFDLSHRPDRLRTYEIVLREGTPADIEAMVDGTLLCEAWTELMLPRALRSAWSTLVSPERTARTVLEAS